MLVGTAGRIGAHPVGRKGPFLLGQEFGGLGIIRQEEPDANADNLCISINHGAIRQASRTYNGRDPFQDEQPLIAIQTAHARHEANTGGNQTAECATERDGSGKDGHASSALGGFVPEAEVAHDAGLTCQLISDRA